LLRYSISDCILCISVEPGEGSGTDRDRAVKMSFSSSKKFGRNESIGATSSRGRKGLLKRTEKSKRLHDPKLDRNQAKSESFLKRRYSQTTLPDELIVSPKRKRRFPPSKQNNSESGERGEMSDEGEQQNMGEVVREGEEKVLQDMANEGNDQELEESAKGRSEGKDSMALSQIEHDDLEFFPDVSQIHGKEQSLKCLEDDSDIEGESDPVLQALQLQDERRRSIAPQMDSGSEDESGSTRRRMRSSMSRVLSVEDSWAIEYESKPRDFFFGKVARLQVPLKVKTTATGRRRCEAYQKRTIISKSWLASWFEWQSR